MGDRVYTRDEQQENTITDLRADVLRISAERDAWKNCALQLEVILGETQDRVMALLQEVDKRE